METIEFKWAEQPDPSLLVGREMLTPDGISLCDSGIKIPIRWADALARLDIGGELLAERYELDGSGQPFLVPGFEEVEVTHVESPHRTREYRAGGPTLLPATVPIVLRRVA